MFTNLTSEQIRKKYHFDKHIWEGWHVRDFIDCLEPSLDRVSFSPLKRGSMP